MISSAASYDAAIIGGGPIGCVTAIAYARRGARVLMLEANPRSCTRFAGEWIHPPGVDALDRLRAGRLEPAETCSAYGFVVFPDDGSAAIPLPYADGAVAITCDHEAMVTALREKAASVGVEYLPDTRVTSIEGNRLRATPRSGGAEFEVTAGRIVGAEGRSSLTRRHLGLPENSTLLSSMASIELIDTELPFEGFGHVLLGGPGPVLMYRIATNRIRVCLDVPVSFAGARRDARFLWDAFGPLFPEALRPAFRTALEERKVAWAATRFRPRSTYGKDNVALVGDAVGHFHPMTAAGLTMGFLDAEALAANKKVSKYESTREKQSYVPELLANVLYHVLRRDDENAARVRSSVYDVWRESSSVRETTMRFLTGDEAGTASFGSTFSRIALHAAHSTVADSLSQGHWGRLAQDLASYGQWVRWPAATIVPGRLRRRYRVESSAFHPIPALAASFEAKAARTRAPTKKKRTKPLVADVILRSARHELLAELSRISDEVEPNRDDLTRRAALLLRTVDRIESTLRVTPAADREGRGRVVKSLRELAFESSRGVATPGAETLAVVLLALLDSPSAGGDGAEAVDAAVESLLRHQGENAMFAADGDPPLRATSLACQALGAYARHYPAAVGAPVARALNSALTRLRGDQREDGSWSGTITATGLAIDALRAGGAPPSDPALRRAANWVYAHGDETETRDVARRLRALLATKAPYCDLVDETAVAAASALKVQLAETRAITWPLTCELIEGLASAEAERMNRPTPKMATSREPRRDMASEPPKRRAPVSVLPVEDTAKPTRGDRQWCRARLEEVSRSFSKPILMLPDPLDTAVTCGYLLCRIADTIEDHPSLPLEQRDELFTAFLKVLKGSETSHEVVDAFRRVEGADAEVELARGLPRVMRVFRDLPRKTQLACTKWISEMARGMSLYSHRTAGPDGIIAVISTDDLERYCYYVAGTVGHMLTELFVDEFGHQLDRNAEVVLRHNSESFGAGLQLVNILKDVTDDMERSVSYLPRNLCQEHGLEIRELFEPAKRDRAHAVAAPLLDIAEKRLGMALEYTLAVPPTQKGVRMFCLIPLWMAARTLVLARGNDAMFTAGAPVKISRMEMAKLMAECGNLFADDDALRDAYSRLWTAPAGDVSAAEQA